MVPICTDTLILSYYSVIGGWTVAYIVYSVTGTFAGLTGQGASILFESFVGNPIVQVSWHTVFMVLTMYIVGRGVQSGLEKAVIYLMPALFI